MSHGNKADAVIAPNSPFYMGSFGWICSKLPPWHPPQVPKGASEKELEDFFVQFANKHMTEEPGALPADIAKDDGLRRDLDAKFESKTPAAYTYFGQFIDHDITLDPSPLSEAEIDPNRIKNFRTPRLDLDCIYGAGPGDQPYLYEHDGGRMTGRLIVGRVDNTGGFAA
jgi:hypothetical protein